MLRVKLCGNPSPMILLVLSISFQDRRAVNSRASKVYHLFSQCFPNYEISLPLMADDAGVHPWSSGGSFRPRCAPPDEVHGKPYPTAAGRNGGIYRRRGIDDVLCVTTALAALSL